MAKIGILNFTRTANTGGTFQYAITLIESLKAYSKHQYLIFYDDANFKNFCAESDNCRFVYIPLQESKIAGIIFRKIATLFGYKSYLALHYKTIKDAGVDLLIDIVSSPLGFCLKLPYIVVVYDIMHKYYPGFPEYSWPERLCRDILYKKAATHSIFTIVDSNQGREDLYNFYGIEKEKTEVIAYYPAYYVYKYRNINESDIVKIIDKYGIPERFIFYPAQFWRHKNHLRLLRAVKLLNVQYNMKIPVVFVGSLRNDSRQTFFTMMKMIKKSGLNNQVFCLGYVKEEEVVAFYKRAGALVYPTLIGPTNIPILEAMFLGTPVVCSNLFSMPEQIKDAGLLFNPFDVKDMAEKIYRIFTDDNLRRELVQKGYDRVKNMTIKNYAGQWEDLINHALQKIGTS